MIASAQELRDTDRTREGESMLNAPRRFYRDPAECYDVVYDAMPDRPEVSRIIDHPRKLITINLMANAWTAMPEEIFRDRTCYDEEDEFDFD